MPIKTLDIEHLKEVTGNKYELMVILGKRARQIAAQEKLELDEKLQYFESIDTCVLFGHDTSRKIWSIWILIHKLYNPVSSLWGNH